MGLRLLPQARHVVFNSDALRNRATTFGVDLTRVKSVGEILDILGDPKGELSPPGVFYFNDPGTYGPISHDSFRVRVSSLVEACEHPLQRKIAHELNGSRAHTVVSFIAGPEVPMNTSNDLVWSFSGWTRLMNESHGWQVPVEGSMVFQKIGRSLFRPGTLAYLERTGDPVLFDDDMDQGDAYS